MEKSPQPRAAVYYGKYPIPLSNRFPVPQGSSHMESGGWATIYNRPGGSVSARELHEDKNKFEGSSDKSENQFQQPDAGWGINY